MWLIPIGEEEEDVETPRKGPINNKEIEEKPENRKIYRPSFPPT